MTIPVFSPERLDAVAHIDQDWLFDNLLVMLQYCRGFFDTFEYSHGNDDEEVSPESQP